MGALKSHPQSSRARSEYRSRSGAAKAQRKIAAHHARKQRNRRAGLWAKASVTVDVVSIRIC